MIDKFKSNININNNNNDNLKDKKLLFLILTSNII